MVSRSTRVWGRGFYCGILGLAFVFLSLLLQVGMLTGVGMTLIISAIILMLSSYCIRDQPPKVRQSATSTNELPAELPAPSVTERTTNLFEGPAPEGTRTDSVSEQ